MKTKANELFQLGSTDLIFQKYNDEFTKFVGIYDYAEVSSGDKLKVVVEQSAEQSEVHVLPSA